MSAANRQYAFRLPADLVERLDAFARARARFDRRPCTRSDALRLLIKRGLALEIERGLPLEMPAKVKGPAFETPAKPETIRGNITDEFEAEAPAKKKPPHRRQDRVPGVAFSEATDHTEPKATKKWPGG